MNIYRILGDLCLVSSSFIFIYKSLRYGSEDISLVTQFLRLVMFCTRYLDIFVVFINPYNTFTKIFLVLSTLILVLILTWQKINLHGSRGLGSAMGVITVTIVNSFFAATWINYLFTLMEILWSFSRFLSVGAEVRQLVMVYHMDKWDSGIIAYYLTVSGHAVFSMGNWVYRYLTEGSLDPIAIFCELLEVVVIAAYFIASFIRAKTGSEHCDVHTIDSKGTEAGEPYIVDQKIPLITIEDFA